MLKLGKHPARGVALLHREGAFDIRANEAAIRQRLESPSCRALARVDPAGSFADGKNRAPLLLPL
jgi:hypothetical protein